MSIYPPYTLITRTWLGAARRGKRSGVFGAFLLAVYTGEGEEFQTISKIGTGFSEEQLKAFSEQLRALTIPAPKPYYRRVPLYALAVRRIITPADSLHASMCHRVHAIFRGLALHVNVIMRRTAPSASPLMCCVCVCEKSALKLHAPEAPSCKSQPFCVCPVVDTALACAAPQGGVCDRP